MTFLFLTRRDRHCLAFFVGLVVGRMLRRNVPPSAAITVEPGQRIMAVNATGSGIATQELQDNALARLIDDAADLPDGLAQRTGRRLTDHAVTGVQARLERSHDELRKLSAALQTIREQERTHIARELHDDLGQLLASLRMDLTLLQQAEDNSDTSLQLMTGMQANLTTAITSLRRIATNLRPRALDDGGLYFALQGLRDEFSRRYNIACALYADEDELQLDDDASTAIFRIVQEALTNIARHADAHNVVLNLYKLDGELLVTIRDDGRGITETDMEKAGSLGLVGMRERVWGMQGEIVVASDEPPGTRIDIVLPIRQHVL